MPELDLTGKTADAACPKCNQHAAHCDTCHGTGTVTVTIQDTIYIPRDELP